MEQSLDKKCGGILVLCLIVLCAGFLGGCKDDSIKKETIALVNEKTERALNLYHEIEALVEDYSLIADDSFTGMKGTLLDMSEKIRADIENTTEEDGQLTIQELDQIIANLQEVKAKVTDMIETSSLEKTSGQNKQEAVSGQQEEIQTSSAEKKDDEPTKEPEPTETPVTIDLTDLE